ncbi:hypothetical protein LBMAG42_09030 [Deltaproteobacteria bacterium]|nr:hypothetical protein LBMAG42_09030 [Deltaproteobacteria bacterium]
MSPAGRKGFTLVELAVVITVLLVFVPAVYGMIGLRAEAAARQRWQMEVAEGARTTAEWMALDAAASAAGPLGACLPRYAVDGEGQERVLLRELPPGCGVSQAVARQVEAISPAAGGVEVTFAKAFRPGRTERVTVFFPWPLPNGEGR